MMAESENAPLIPWLFAAGRLSGATVCDHGLGLGATIRQCSSITWIDQHLVNAVSGRQAPDDLAPRRCRLHLGEGELFIAVPQRGLTGTAEFAKLLKHPRDGLLHLAVWIFSIRSSSVRTKPTGTSHIQWPCRMLSSNACRARCRIKPSAYSAIEPFIPSTKRSLSWRGS